MPVLKPLIAILTTCEDDWGGSEELWAQAVPHLQKAGYALAVYRNNLNPAHPEYRKLKERGVLLAELKPAPVLLRDRIRDRILHKFYKPRPTLMGAEHTLSVLLNQQKPGLVLISQAINFDGLNFASVCLAAGIPYVIISQKAVEFYWPGHQGRAHMREVYQHALKVYFVSAQNQTLTEEQFGCRFTQAGVLCNPIKVERRSVSMPDTHRGYRLACIGRYFILDKGQDILIRILAQPQWKARSLTVSFIGSGNDRQGLVEMAALLGVTNVEFLNQADDIGGLWKSYHGLVLPARSEGTPLVLLEAMACGRVSIVSTAGGNAEFILDGHNGFIGQANTFDFDQAMERAWNRRHEWGLLGSNALQTIQEKVPAKPEELLAAELGNLYRSLPR